MDFAMAPHQIPDTDCPLVRSSAFSYRCNACSRCCHKKAIRVGPYEILRLARRLGISTSEFIASYTEAGGTTLRVREHDDRACIFLGEHGCSVHPDRPLVCRLYPLSLRYDDDGTQSFAHLPAHPETEGVYGKDGTVDDFLKQQAVAPYFDAVEKYKRIYNRMIACLEQLDERELETLSARKGELLHRDDGRAATPWLDVDRTVAEYCSLKHRPVPDAIDDVIAIHIEAIEAWIDSLNAPDDKADSAASRDAV